MHLNILTKKQIELLDFVSKFRQDYYLVGGTAVALQIGHRRSIDFDLFTYGKFDSNQVKKFITKSGFTSEIVYEKEEQMTIIINKVKMTFYDFPFEIEAKLDFKNYIKMPDILTLAAMKAYALGRRAKWKDYVDIYFILKNYHSLNEINNRAVILFGSMYNEKLLKQQLCYFEDIDYKEEVEYVGEKIDEKIVKDFLIELVIKKL